MNLARLYVKGAPPRDMERYSRLREVSPRREKIGNPDAQPRHIWGGLQCIVRKSREQIPCDTWRNNPHLDMPGSDQNNSSPASCGFCPVQILVKSGILLGILRKTVYRIEHLR